MLHWANANFPATDTESNRAANIQTASEVQLYGSTGFKRQNRKPETNRKQKHMLAWSWSSHGLFHFPTFFLTHLPEE